MFYRSLKARCAKTSRKRLLLAAAITLVLASVLASLFGPTEPAYKGRKLRSWLMDLSTPETTEEELGRVQAAIQDFGPDAPKWLLLREKELENPTLSTSFHKYNNVL